MRRLAWLVVCIVVALGIVLAYRWFESSLEVDRRKAIADSLSDFRQHQAQYVALISAWRGIYKSSDACGLPPPALGMVQFRIFALKESGSYRVTVNGKDAVFPSIQEAASALHLEPEQLQLMAGDLRSVNRASIYQHDAEIRVPAGENYGVLFVPPSCPQASRYDSESRPGAVTSFVNLIALGGGWYYYAERT
jgi:hypothetical protein